MRLVQYRRKDAPLVARSVGVELADGGAVVDISHLASSTLQLLEGGKEAEWSVRNYLATSPPTVDPAGLVLEAPLTNMDKVTTWLAVISYLRFLPFSIDILLLFLTFPFGVIPSLSYALSNPA